MICDSNYYWSDKWFIKKRTTYSWFINGDLPYTWFVSNERISLKNGLLLNSGLSSSFQLSSRLYENIRRLKLNTIISMYQFDLRWVEKFEQLEQLEIYEITLLENVSIILPNLNKLFIGSILKKCFNKTEYLVFNTPRLQFAYFGYNVLDAVRLMHFNCLEYLEFEGDGGYSDLNHFKNLRIVHCNAITKISLHLIRSLTRLPNLTELHCNSFSLTVHSPNMFGAYRTPSDAEVLVFKRVFNHCFVVKNGLKQLNFKLYFDGLLIKGDQEFDKYKFGQLTFQLHMKDYASFVVCSPQCQVINFSELIESTNVLPVNIIEKYPNIIWIYVKNAEEDKLIWFLKGCRNLVYLQIQASFTQRFYDQLVDYNCELRHLAIDNYSYELDFKFLYKLEFLVNFYTQSPLSVDFAHRLMKGLKYCTYISYRWDIHKEKHISFRKVLNNYTIKIWPKTYYVRRQ